MYDHQERLEREFAPTMTHLREVEGQIEFHKAEIAKLQDIHRKLAAIERIIHPPAPKPKPKASPNGTVSEATLQEAIVYLRASYPDEDIYSSRLVADEGWTPSDSHTSKILAELHQRDLIRLDSKGIGGRKNFRVVT